MFSTVSQKGNLLKVVDNYKYRKDRLTQEGQKWRCTVRNCKASILTTKDGEQLMRTGGIHEHSAAQFLQILSNSVTLDTVNGELVDNQTANHFLSNALHDDKTYELNASLTNLPGFTIYNIPKPRMRFRVIIRRDDDFEVQLTDLLKIENIKNERGIIYCKSPEDGDKIAEKLVKSGLNAYHIQGGFYQVKSIIKSWILNEIHILITNDKEDIECLITSIFRRVQIQVRFIIHAHIPESMYDLHIRNSFVSSGTFIDCIIFYNYDVDIKNAITSSSRSYAFEVFKLCETKTQCRRQLIELSLKELDNFDGLLNDDSIVDKKDEDICSNDKQITCDVCKEKNKFTVKSMKNEAIQFVKMVMDYHKKNITFSAEQLIKVFSEHFIAKPTKAKLKVLERLLRKLIFDGYLQIKNSNYEADTRFHVSLGSYADELLNSNEINVNIDIENNLKEQNLLDNKLINKYNLNKSNNDKNNLNTSVTRSCKRKIDEVNNENEIINDNVIVNDNEIVNENEIDNENEILLNSFIETDFEVELEAVNIKPDCLLNKLI